MNMETVRDILVDILKRRFASAAVKDKTYVEAHSSFIAYCTAELRIHSIASRKDLEDIWNKDIRTWEVRMDFLIDVTRELRARVSGFNDFSDKFDNWDKLVFKLSEAMAVFWHDKDNKNVIADVEVKARSLSAAEWKEYMTANPWLVTMVLIEQTQPSVIDLGGDPNLTPQKRTPTPGKG